jgi:hypothetical protein
VTPGNVKLREPPRQSRGFPNLNGTETSLTPWAKYGAIGRKNAQVPVMRLRAAANTGTVVSSLHVGEVGVFSTPIEAPRRTPEDTGTLGLRSTAQEHEPRNQREAVNEQPTERRS